MCACTGCADNTDGSVAPAAGGKPAGAFPNALSHPDDNPNTNIDCYA